MINQIRHAQSVMRTLNANGFNAVIAGGAPRDWLLGRKATDLDVFILSDITTWYNTDNDRVQSIIDLNERQAFEEQFVAIERLGRADGQEVEIYHGVNGIASVHNSRYGTNNINVQLIFVRDFSANSVVERFPDICQAWMPNEGAIRATSEFFRAHDNKYSIVERANAHTQKLRNKFPDYDFINDNDEEEVDGWGSLIRTPAPENPWVRTFTTTPNTNVEAVQNALNRIRENGTISSIRGSLVNSSETVSNAFVNTDNRIFF